MPDTREEKPRIDRAAFRNALGAFVTGVTIVTTRDENGRPVGLTANSFNSVSLDPPMVLWSLGLNSGSLTAFRDARWWAVHILGSDQEVLSARFATRGVDKFAGLALREGPDKIPLLQGCTARFICRTAFEYEGGDHAIFVGEVTEFERGPQIPLAFHQGRYARVLAPEVPAADVLAYGGQFGRRFMGHYLGRAHYEVFDEIRREYRRRGLNGREYTVLTVLGYSVLDEPGGVSDTPIEQVIQSAARGGVEVNLLTIKRLQERGFLVAEQGRVRLSAPGRQVVVELMAVAQASQARIEDRLAPGELVMLRHLIGRIINPPSPAGFEPV